MAQYDREWEELGRNVQDIIDRAVNSHDFQKLDETIRQVVDRAVDLGSEAVRHVTKPSVVEAKEQRVTLYGKTGGMTAWGAVKSAAGGVLAVIGLLGTLGALALSFVTNGLVTPGIGHLALIAGGGVLLVSGTGTLKKVKRFRTYRRTLGQKTHCTLEKLAQSVGKSIGFVRREIRGMIKKGLFLEGHLNREGTELITSHETYRHYQNTLLLEEKKRQEEQKRAAAGFPKEVQEVLDRGDAFIREIRRCNDNIPGEAVSAKIDRMELIVRRIFDRAQAHPEIVPDLKKLMDYYLPMTVKLLNAYADMDAQPVQGETIRTSKKEIEATLDTLNLAFEKLLDSVYEDTAMDISSDISVLNTLLAQEGLTEDELTKMKNKG